MKTPQDTLPATAASAGASVPAATAPDLMPRILRCGTFELLMTQEAGEAKTYRHWCETLHLVDYRVTFSSPDLGRVVEGQAGDVLLCSRSTQITFQSDAPGRHICFHFDLLDPADRARVMPGVRVLRPEGEPGTVQAECHQVMQDFWSTEPARKEAAAWRFRALLLRLLAVPPAAGDSATPRRAEQAVDAALAYIDTHLGQHVTLPELAAQVDLEPNYLAAQFRARVGRPVMAYRMERRLQQARHLLTCTNYPLKTIAEELGFTDCSHLSHAFRKRFGMPPGRLRATSRA